MSHEMDEPSFLDRLAVLQASYLESLDRTGKSDTPARNELREHMASASQEDLVALALKHIKDRGQNEDFEVVLGRLMGIRELCANEMKKFVEREPEDLIEID